MIRAIAWAACLSAISLLGACGKEQPVTAPPSPVPSPAPSAQRGGAYDGIWWAGRGTLVLEQCGIQVAGAFLRPSGARYPVRGEVEGGRLVLYRGKGNEPVQSGWLDLTLKRQLSGQISLGENWGPIGISGIRIGSADAQGVPALSLALQSEESGTRIMAADSLGSLGPLAKAALPALLQALDDPHPAVLRQVRDALARVGAPSPADLRQLRCLLLDRNPSIREAAADKAGMLGAAARELGSDLANALADPHPGVRLSASAAQAAIGRASIPRILEAAREGDPSVKRMAMGCLRRMGPTGLGVMESLVRSGDKDLSIEASKELDRKSTFRGGFWPQSHGPARDNTSTDTGLLEKWPDGGPPIAWEVWGLGRGIAGIVVADGRVFTLGYIGGHEYLTALDERTGRRLWSVPIGPSITEQGHMRWLGQRTPMVDGDRVYAFHGSGILVCVESSTGKELWRISYEKTFGEKTSGWEWCDRPEVEGEKLICAPGTEKTCLAALDKRSGRVLWKTPGGHGWTSGASVIREIGGVRQVLSHFSQDALGVEVSTGRLLWTYEVPCMYAKTPVVWKDQIAVTDERRRRGVVLLRPVATEAGFQVEARECRNTGELYWMQDSGVALGRHLYTWALGLICLSLDSGEVLWRDKAAERSTGSMTCAGGNLVVLATHGRVSLIKATPEGCIAQSEFSTPFNSLDSTSATNPVVTGGCLYLRDEDHLICYDLRESVDLDWPRPTGLVLPPPSLETDGVDGRSLPNAVYVPTPEDVVIRMLEVAKAGSADTVVDLGSGDGRILVQAATRFAARGRGYEIDPGLVEASLRNIALAGVGDRVRIEQKDLFTANLKDATVVALYLPPEFLERLVPLFRKLPPGSRIVSHQFKIPGVKPDREEMVESIHDHCSHAIYLWKTPFGATDR